MRYAAVASVGVGIAAIEMVPIGIRALRAIDPAERYAEVGELLSFLTDFLALVVCHRGEECVEIDIARVVPVELEAAAVHERRRFERDVVRFGGEQDMEGRKPQIFRKFERGMDQRRAVRIVACQQARSRDRREGYAA